jgi:hypothetical protein
MFALPPPAGAFVYWANFNGNQTIGRATLDGSAADGSFITGERHPCGLAVDSAHIYWANLNGSTSGGLTPGATIGRANIDGSGADQNFIAGPYYPCGVAVDSAHVYWANTGIEGIIGEQTGTTIGRANLDGTAVDQNFIGKANGPCGVAVDSAHVYWANRIGDTIGRANLDGSGIEADFIRGADGPCGVAVDSGHVYWTNTGYDRTVTPVYSGTTIGRANLDGSAPDQSFITGTGTGPLGVAVDSAHVYWASFFSFTIGRANLDGSASDPSVIAGGGNPAGVAVNADPASLFEIIATIVDASRGTAILTLDAVGPGVVRLSGEDVRPTSGSFHKQSTGNGDQTVTQAELKVAPDPQAKKVLVEDGRLKVKVKITYTPTGGAPERQQTKLVLKKH